MSLLFASTYMNKTFLKEKNFGQPRSGLQHLHNQNDQTFRKTTSTILTVKTTSGTVNTDAIIDAHRVDGPTSGNFFNSQTYCSRDTRKTPLLEYAKTFANEHSPHW